MKVAARIDSDLAKFDGHAERTLAFATGWTRLEPAETARVMPDVFRRIKRGQDRQQVLKAFFHARHPAALALLDLGMADPDPKVRSWAAEFLSGASFMDFRANPDFYPVWKAAQQGLALAVSIRRNAADYVARLRRTLPGELPDITRQMFDFVRTANIRELADSGLADLLAEWVSAGVTSVAENALRVLTRLPVDPRRLEALVADWLSSGLESSARAVLRHLPELPLRETFLRRTVVPVFQKRPGLRAAAARALGRPGARWAVRVLVPLLSDPSDDVVLAAAEALGQIGDRSAVRPLVEALQADPSPGRQHAITQLGLEPLTGVGEVHDAAWWAAWGKRGQKTKVVKRGKPAKRGKQGKRGK